MARVVTDPGDAPPASAAAEVPMTAQKEMGKRNHDMARCMRARVLDLEPADKPRATDALRVAEVELQSNLSAEEEAHALAYEASALLDGALR